jgi:hypothetical protein
MGDEFYAIIKLVSGEEILSLVCPDENDGDAVLILQNPITMKMLETPHGIHVKVKSWMELASDNFFIIRPDKILTMTETHDERMIEIYTNYLEDDMDVYKPQSSSNEKPKGIVKPSRKMGYLSSVEEARKSLENIFKLEDTKES